MLRVIVLLLCLSYITSLSGQVSKEDLKLDKGFINAELENAAQQIKFLAQSIDKSALPTTYSNGKHVNWGASWWCSGFYPGTVLYLYEYTKDPELLAEAKTKLGYLEKEKLNTSTHDLGFMLYCSFGNALRITQDTIAYKDILITGANSLLTRFNNNTQTIRSWDGGKNWDGVPWTYPVIINNMMNLEFLTQASKLSGDRKYYDVAIAHANSTLKNHFRNNYSSYHVVDYDTESGEVINRKTAQGAFDESSWSRGQAWALYGFVMMYRETKDRNYLDQAVGIADFYLNHANLAEDMVPYWDMDQNKVNVESKYYSRRELRDVSTASIVASALLELGQYTAGDQSRRYMTSAEIMITSLATQVYKANYRDNGGFILKHSVGSIPHDTEVDVPLTYADYYYVEALTRYLRLLNNKKVV